MAARLEFTSNADDVVRALRRSPKIASEEFSGAMAIFLDKVGDTAAREGLQGPRPEKLGVVTSRLVRSLAGGRFAFTGGLRSFSGLPRQLRGGQDSIRRVESSGQDIVGTIGTEVEYAATHEFGLGGMPARPFLKPAMETVTTDRSFLNAIFGGAMSRIWRRLGFEGRV